MPPARRQRAMVLRTSGRAVSPPIAAPAQPPGAVSLGYHLGMKAGDELLGHVFNQDRRYEIPIFQRPYVWNEDDNWVPLWQDIRKAAEATGGGGESPQEHFLGAFVTQHRPPQP